jgi:hypothetical protein
LEVQLPDLAAEGATSAAESGSGVPSTPPHDAGRVEEEVATVAVKTVEHLGIAERPGPGLECARLGFHCRVNGTS